MTREILFRGKRIDDGEWMYGVPAFCKKDGRAFMLKTEGCAGHLIYHAEVIPETVGQYTGFTDKNGTNIFEGDILKGFEYPYFREEDGTHNYFTKVIWFDESCAFATYTFKNPESNVRGISHGNMDYFMEFDTKLFEVIGNIHEWGCGDGFSM